MSDRPPLHALLIGIDAYAISPLTGAVNDIDRVEKLLHRAGSASIRRLASPGNTPATLDNIRAALMDLASPERAGARIFIYYAGHGFRYQDRARHRTHHREALVPVDYTEGARLLYDYELNGLIRAIAARTRALTFILDCCHSSGVTRSPAVSMVRRSLTAADVPRDGFDPAAAAMASAAGGLGRIEDCHVIAACLDHESAHESAGPDGVVTGLLTRALVAELEALGDTNLHTIAWSRIWQGVRERVLRENATQHVWMSGHPGRAVLAGAPVEGDVGYAITAEGGGRYRIHAGELAGVTRGARIAVYGETPAFFTPLHHKQKEERERIATLEVTEPPGPAAALATADRPFETRAARGRLVEAGEAARVRCAVLAPDDAIVAVVAQSKLLELVTGKDAAQVCLELHDGRWAVTDDVHDLANGPPLFVFDRGSAALAREVLEHYTRYYGPIALANRATDLQGLVLSVRVCPAHDLTPEQAQVADLPEAPEIGLDAYTVPIGGRIAFHVRNGCPVGMHVTLVNCGSSGKVLLLGDQQIPAGAAHIFWAGSRLGAPFILTGKPGLIDRVIAIGRTDLAASLDYLRVDTRFADLAVRLRGEVPRGARSEPYLEKWAAHQIVLRIPPGGSL